MAAGCSLRRKFDALDESDLPAFVLDDTVAVQTVAVLVEGIGALYALVAVDPEDTPAHGFGIGAVRFLNGDGKDVQSVVRPARERVGIDAVLIPILLGKRSRLFVGVGCEVRDRIG